MIPKHQRPKVLIDDHDVSAVEGGEWTSQSELLESENLRVDDLISRAAVMSLNAGMNQEPVEHECKELSSIQASLDRAVLVHNLNTRLDLSKFGMAIGSLKTCNKRENDIFDIDAIHAEPPKGVDSKSLARVWKIDEKLAKSALQ